MQSMKEKISNMASSCKERIDIGKANVEERLEKKAARTEEEKKLAHERKKAKEARAKMEYHQDKVRHAEERLRAKQPQYLHGYGYDHEQPPVGTAAPPTAGHAVPLYPVSGHPPPYGHQKY